VFKKSAQASADARQRRNLLRSLFFDPKRYDLTRSAATSSTSVSASTCRRHACPQPRGHPRLVRRLVEMPRSWA